MLRCVLFTTPMCGTCSVARKMLFILNETYKEDNVEFIELNFNDNLELVKKYQLESTPAFVIEKDGIFMEKFYAFHSINFLYDKINKYF